MRDMINLIGLGLDFAGFAILLREWWIAVFSQEADIAFEEKLQKQLELDAFAMQSATGNMKEHMERSSKMRAGHAISQARAERRARLSARRKLYVTAAVLIVVGSLMQFAGSIPEAWLALG